ncbi:MULTISPECIES: helix-turn-helix transcriptional regulator [unclassified Ruegeria]|uniref:helix-turn-helix domain-containing protein n=1 Tax=unclassified Ruegeria TaxID=2625375 RepID=UPI001AE47743|nr:MULTISPECIES: helix-turn-helix transcriptional regulator [unclassified Ruegeria]
MSKTIRSSGHKALCQAIVDARKRSGLSQEQVAERLHCQQSLIARIESEERRIDVVELIVICRALGVDPEEVLRVTEAATQRDHYL